LIILVSEYENSPNHFEHVITTAEQFLIEDISNLIHKQSIGSLRYIKKEKKIDVLIGCVH